jgi:hypothetical protein
MMYVVKHDSGILESHLLCRGFMNGYTRWIGDEDDEVVDGAVGNEEHGHQDKHDEGGHDHEEQDIGADDVGHDHEEQDVGAYDVGYDHEDQDAGETP